MMGGTKWLEELIARLSRYSEQCIAERFDPDFAEAIIDTIEWMKGYCAMKMLNEGLDMIQVSEPEYDRMCRAMLLANYIKDVVDMIKEM